MSERSETVVRIGLLILTFARAIFYCVVDPIEGFALFLVWFMSTVACIAIGGWRQGKWSLLSAPIALFPWGYLLVSCSISHACV